MNYGSMKTLLLGSGHEYLTSAEVTDFLQRAVDDTESYWPWPWRASKFTAFTPGGGHAFFEEVDAVFYGDYELEQIENEATARRVLGASYSAAGDPRYFCHSGGSIYTFPALSAVDVYYYDRQPWISGGGSPASDSDILKMPAQYHDTPVLRARQFAYEETDELTEAANMENRWKERLEEMREKLVRDRVRGRDYVKLTQPMV